MKVKQIENTICWADIDGHYELLANRFSALTESNLVFSTKLRNNRPFSELLVKEDISAMFCNSCENFLERVSGSVYIDDDGLYQSAFWDSSVAKNENARLAFDFLASAAVHSANNEGLRSPLNASAKNTGHGIKGNFAHFHAIFHETYPSGLQDLFDRLLSLSGYLASDFAGLDSFHKTAREVNGLLKELGEIPESIRSRVEWIANLDNHPDTVTSNRDRVMHWMSVGYREGTLATRLLALVGLRDGVVYDLYKATHKGTVSEQHINVLRSRTEVGVYQAKQTSKVDEAALENLKGTLRQFGVLSAWPFKAAVVQDILPTWVPDSASKIESPENEDALSKLIADKFSKPADDGIIKLTSVENISARKFITDVLPFAKSIDVKASTLPWGYLIKAGDTQSGPIFKWDALNSRRPYVSVMGAHPGFGDNWLPVESIAPKPWCDDAYLPSKDSALSGGLMLLVSSPLDSRYLALTNFSVGQVVVPGLFPSRDAIDYMFQNIPVDHSGGEIAHCGMIGPNGTSGVLRVTTEKVRRTYQLTSWD